MATLYEKLQKRREAHRKQIEEIDLLLSLLQKHGVEDVDTDDDINEADLLADDDENSRREAPPTHKPIYWSSRTRRQFDFSAGDIPIVTTIKSGKTERPTRNLPKARMSQVVTQILKDHKRPMTRTEIVDALELMGIPVAGVDRSKAIGTIMWRMRDEFVNLPGWGYWFKGEDYPKAAYQAPSREPEGDTGDDKTKSQTALALTKPDVTG
ncbi:hypothetical protein [Mesorhizobium sp. ES1-1]|uniref:hypothetical protein n=1 Tax=Mesorhizobium sp. ES1-1 TaxID=2876629 RepID=UPI001CCF18B9|nr:hypothetical protein [Mesorhizobium sp. ES1-1]MBZ9674530.1 hypothetical protein [Mesorhizobium sp. ES1-1]